MIRFQISNRSEQQEPSERVVSFQNNAALLTLIVVAFIVFIFSVITTWTGYLESDDLFYANAAEEWLQGGLYLGSSHWAIRHCIVLPMAAFFGVFGTSEATLALTSLMYAVAVLGLLACIAYQLHGPLAGAITVMIVCSIPIVATGASVVTTDLPEAFFVIGSVWAYYRAGLKDKASLFLLSGIMAGCALITRETTVALLVLYLALFLAGRCRNFPNYLWIALGCTIVVGLDWLYLTSLSGDPLYRLHIALKGVHGDGPQMEGLYANASGVDRFGSLSSARVIRPFVIVFVNQNFGLFYWLAVPATIWLSLSAGPARQAARLFGGLALAWFLVLGYLLEPWLWVIPRYYVTCVVMAIPLAILLVNSLTAGRSWVAAGVLTMLLLANTTLNLGVTTDLLGGEHELVRLAGTTSETIHTDPGTMRGAGWLLERKGLGGRVTAAVPGPGDLYFFNSQPRRQVPSDWSIKSPPAGWTRLSGNDGTRKWTRVFLQLPLISSFLPPGFIHKLDQPPRVTALYRVPPG